MLEAMSQHLTDLPTIPYESRRLIAAFINADQDVENLAVELNADFFDLIHKLCDPAVKQWIAAINALKNNERRERALRALDATLTRSTDQRLIHRAASRLLRHLEVTKPRRPSGQSSTPPGTQPETPEGSGVIDGLARHQRDCNSTSPPRFLRHCDNHFARTPCRSLMLSFTPVSRHCHASSAHRAPEPAAGSSRCVPSERPRNRQRI